MAEQQDNQDIGAISRALSSPDAQVRIQAIKSALAYGDAGAKLVIQLMKKGADWQVRFAAWKCLLGSDCADWRAKAQAYQLPLRRISYIQKKSEKI